jgi:hypothetical protein
MPPRLAVALAGAGAQGVQRGGLADEVTEQHAREQQDVAEVIVSGAAALPLDRAALT